VTLAGTAAVRQAYEIAISLGERPNICIENVLPFAEANDAASLGSADDGERPPAASQGALLFDCQLAQPGKFEMCHRF
jgi:hypothetical protein